jgi:hypothetical protein
MNRRVILAALTCALLCLVVFAALPTALVVSPRAEAAEVGTVGFEFRHVVLSNGTTVLARFISSSGEAWYTHSNTSEWIKISDASAVNSGQYDVTLVHAADEGTFRCYRLDKATGNGWSMSSNAWSPITEPKS